jgi:hypothetical protein
MIPVAAVVLCATVVGVPLGLFVLVIYLWLLYLSQLTLGVALADILVGVDGKAGWRLFFGVALGLLVVQFLTYIPYLKTLIALAGLVMGLGALGIMTRNEFTLVRTRHQGAS